MPSKKNKRGSQSTPKRPSPSRRQHQLYPDDFDLTEWCDTQGLSSSTCHKLYEAGFTTLRVLKLMKDSDIVLLQLETLGQARLLEHCVKEMSNPVAPEEASQEPARTTQPGADISQLLAQLGVTQDVEEDLAPQASSSGHQPIDSDPTLYLRAPQKQGEKALQITDFLHSYGGSQEEEEEEILHSAGGTSIFARKKKSKPKYTEVSQAQWIAANARIMDTLLSRGLCAEGIRQYLGYTAKIGELAQRNTWQSVLTYDLRP